MRHVVLNCWANVLGFRVVNFWNDLPEHLVTADSVNIFKNRFDKHCSHLRFCTDIEDLFKKRWWWCVYEDQSTGYQPMEDWRWWWWWIIEVTYFDILHYAQIITKQCNVVVVGIFFCPMRARFQSCVIKSRYTPWYKHPQLKQMLKTSISMKHIGNDSSAGSVTIVC